MALLRVGAVSIHPDPNSERRFAFDNDLDFFAVCKSKSDREAFCSTIEKKCQEAQIFKGCRGCWVNWPAKGTDLSVAGKEGTDPDTYIFDSRENGDGAIEVSWSKPWVIPHSKIFPLRKAKYYDVAVPVAREPMHFFSNAIPWSAAQPSPEYGSGCDGMAYPAWLTSKANWGSVASKERQVEGLNISRSVLEQCARALDSAGFASFSECFGDATNATN